VNGIQEIVRLITGKHPNRLNVFFALLWMGFFGLDGILSGFRAFPKLFGSVQDLPVRWITYTVVASTLCWLCKDKRLQWLPVGIAKLLNVKQKGDKMAERVKAFDVVQAQRLEIVSDRGEVRAVVHGSSDGAALSLFDPDGNCLLRCGVVGHNAHFALFDAEGNPRAALHFDKTDGAAGCVIYDDAGKMIWQAPPAKKPRSRAKKKTTKSE